MEGNKIRQGNKLSFLQLRSSNSHVSRRELLRGGEGWGLNFPRLHSMIYANMRFVFRAELDVISRHSSDFPPPSSPNAYNEFRGGRIKYIWPFSDFGWRPQAFYTGLFRAIAFRGQEKIGAWFSPDTKNVDGKIWIFMKVEFSCRYNIH